MRINILASDWFRTRLDRLGNITGFVTVYGQEHDPRTRVFAREGHVRRVAGVAARLSVLAGDVDAEQVRILAWIHDLNRWPFAHNSEKGRFDQVANIGAYFALAPGIGRGQVQDLRAIHRKDASTASDEGRVVLLADTLTGMVEDLLLVVAGLNVHPRIITPEVEKLLSLSLRAGGRLAALRRLTGLLHGRERRVELFEVEFDQVFGSLIQDFLREKGVDSLWPAYGELIAVPKLVKETFTRPVVFPLNNDRVCHSGWLRGSVVPWYLNRTPDAAERLLRIDERQFVEEVTAAEDTPFAPEQFRPDIDCVRRDTPAMAFLS
ncbi:HD domain-containing protein [Phytomonospora sp. NPDC050363]|uniref:HD domain-containing protein n=1 Tax=Phytomonospora sp. NPDC050363 TaxID=3155642 RepID=UPI0033C202CD